MKKAKNAFRLSDLALHSCDKYFLRSYYMPGTLAFMLSERQKPLQSSEERKDMI